MSASGLTLEDMQTALSLIPRSDRYPRRMVCEMLLDLIRRERDGDVRSLAEGLGTVFFMQSPTKEMKMIASSAKFSEVISLFGLRESAKFYTLLSKNLVPPAHINLNLRDFEAAGYDRETEASCRLLAEFLLLPAVASAKQEQRNPAKRVALDLPVSEPPSIPGPSKSFAEVPSKPLKVYPEFELEARLKHPDTQEDYIVTGKADWVATYGTRKNADSGSVLYCIEAKQRSTFSQAEAQLVCYLAICRHLRENRINSGVQGFVTDGLQYRFYSISNDGLIEKSKLLEINDPADLVAVYSWIVGQLRTVPYSSPTTTPIKGSQGCKTDAAKRYETEVFRTTFGSVLRPLPVIAAEDDDDDAVIVPLGPYVPRR